VDYFVNYDETRSNDFVLRNGGKDIEMLSSDIADWTITFVHTGVDTPIGERLRRVREYVKGEEVFAANYADVLTDAPLDLIERQLRARGAVGSLLAVPPQAAFHMVEADDDCYVTDIKTVASLRVQENGGYFFFTPEIFDYLNEGEDLVTDALPRLAAERRLVAWPHDGFWKPADTVKERSELDAMARRHERPWALWDEARAAAPTRLDGPVGEHLAAHRPT
jgi:glucose-1-phosphate cytidylyltransferase